MLSTYLVALIAGPYATWQRRARRHPARHLLPRLAGRAHGRRAAVHRDQAGLRLLPPQLRRAVPVRQVRPAVRAGVQRGRDGERGRGDLPGGLRLPVPGHPVRLRAARRDRAARDGAHVVRRPGHHALVGRPVAERVVRHLRQRALPGRGHRVHRGLDDVRQRGEVLGLPAGPAALHAPGGRGHPGPAGRRGQLRRHHLRQGRLGAQAAGGLRRAGAVPGRAAQLLHRARLGQRDLRRPARRAGGGLASATCRAGVRSGCAPPGSTCCAPRSTSTTRVASPGSTWCRAGPGPVPGRCARTGSRSGSTTTRTTAGNGQLVRTHRVEVDVTGERTSVPELVGVAARQAGAGQRRRPHLLRAAPRPGLAGHPRSTGSATSPSRCRAPCAGRRPGR